MSETNLAVRPKRGRPVSSGPKPDKSGLGSILSARISNELRGALETEAERTGRSISQIAERWMDEARAGRASLDGRLGGRTRLRSLIDVIGQIEQEVTAAETNNELASYALASALRLAVPYIIQPNFDVSRALEEGRENREAWRASEEVCKKLAEAAEDDPVVVRGLLPLDEKRSVLPAGRDDHLFEALLAPNNPDFSYSDDYDVALHFPVCPSDRTLRALAELGLAGDTASHEIMRAIELITVCHQRDRGHQVRIEEAKRRGEAIARLVTGYQNAMKPREVL